MVIIDWIAGNWPVCLAVFYAAEKIVKLTKNPYDVILLDIICGSITKVFKK